MEFVLALRADANEVGGSLLHFVQRRQKLGFEIIELRDTAGIGNQRVQALSDSRDFLRKPLEIGVRWRQGQFRHNDLNHVSRGREFLAVSLAGFGALDRFGGLGRLIRNRLHAP
ncbi:hypothetical protein LZK76_27810 (plasmid) [Rhizobium leguminosarum]|nr:hypothetical protein LZK76_27810 [Rhizobium leguminosarum]